MIADSETGTQDIGPHADRPEIVAATTNSPGFSERYSQTLKIPMMYLAVPHENESGEVKGFVRVATPSVPINEAIYSAQRYVWIFAFLLGLLTSALMTFFAWYLMRPLGQFAEAAKKIGEGKYAPTPLLLNRNDEWRTLADAFRTMQTEMINREEGIARNRDRLQAVLASMIEGVLSISSESEILIANHSACRMLGADETKLRGKNIFSVIRNSQLAAAIEKTQIEKTFSLTEFQIVDENLRRTISARVSVLPNPNDELQQTPNIVVVLHDISEIRQLENMRRDLVANVSHELKTPLASIKAYAETLKLGAIHDQDSAIQFVTEIETQADFLNQQIHDLLQLARIESGREVWDIEPVDVNSQCEKCIQRFTSLAQANEIELTMNLGEDDPKARADVEGLITILNNLMANALNYTPVGGRVTLVTNYQNNMAMIEVADTGIGIPKEHQERVFERFYRVDKARSREKGGTGLGLAIVKHLTTSFGGRVELTSEPGEGTTFRIFLPKYVD